jgi:membrane protease YdiL (CAAX protease family)
MVWAQDDAQVRRAGLALGGLVIPGRFDFVVAARAASRSLAWGLALLVIVAAPYAIGWRIWWAPKLPFSLSVRPGEVAGDLLSQVVVIALPEEAFFRGFLQSRLDEVWPPTWNVLGAKLGPGLFVAAAIFAGGHVATVHLAARLAVFFPALLFGWLRARTGGIGASVAFHAMCNVYAQLLGRGYGFY